MERRIETGGREGGVKVAQFEREKKNISSSEEKKKKIPA